MISEQELPQFQYILQSLASPSFTNHQNHLKIIKINQKSINNHKQTIKFPSNTIKIALKNIKHQQNHQQTLILF